MAARPSQRPATQTKPDAQCASLSHVLRQPVSSQTYGTHDEPFGATHAPEPSQRDAPMNSVPEHFGVAHVVAESLAYPTHDFASVLLQVRAAQVSPAPSEHAVRAPCGGPLTAMQRPTRPSTSHASHWPSQRDSQHTPSTQNPLPHSPSAVHFVESFLKQVPSCPVIAQEEPMPQFATPQHTPSVQKPVEQSPAVVHALPRPSAGAHEPLLQ